MFKLVYIVVLLYICFMGKQWSTMTPLNAEYIIQEYLNYKPIAQIAKDLNCTIDRARRVLTMNKIVLKSKSDFYKELNSLKYIFEDNLIQDYLKGNSQSYLSEKYKIGTRKVSIILERNNIEREKGKGAGSKKAWANGTRKPRNCNKGGTKDIYNALFSRWRNNAKSRNYPFNITIEYLQEILENQKYKCALTNMNLLCPKTYNEKISMTSSPYLVSLDRINGDLGYEVNNVQLVCVWANKAKGSYDNKEFLDIINNLKSQV